MVMSKEDQKDNGRNGMSLEIYANSVNFFLSIYDITMDFGSTDKNNKHQSLVKIKMSPQHAKVMSILLSNNIRKYESDIGEINLPDLFLKGLLKEEK
jgi:Protein of unknown function (DUF3467)